MKTIISAIIIAVVLAAGIAAGVIESERAIHNQAVTDCLHAAKDTLPGRNIETPDGYWYAYCMREKGYKK